MKYEIAPRSTERLLKWDDSRFYCFSLIIDGKIGWRLPTNDELNEIYESENDFVGNYYWSSTEYNEIYAWIQFMYCGFQNYFSKNDGNYVRAIRDLKDN